MYDTIILFYFVGVTYSFCKTRIRVVTNILIGCILNYKFDLETETRLAITNNICDNTMMFRILPLYT